MSEQNFSDLPQVFALSGSELIPMNQTSNGTTRTVTAASGLLSAGVSTNAQNANTVLAGPTTGAATAPSFRALVNADIPSTLSITGLTATTVATSTLTSSTSSVGALTGTSGSFSGNVSAANFIPSGTVTQNTFLGGPTTAPAAAPSYRVLVNADIPSALSLASVSLSGAITAASGSIAGTLAVGTVSATALNGSSATISGTATATTFSGSGASLSNIPASAITSTGGANTIVYNSALNTLGSVTANANAVLVTASNNVPSLSTTLPLGINLAASTTATGSAVIASGTIQTTPAAGSIEYDGKVPYLTPNASNRGALSTYHHLTLQADITGSNANTAQAVFAGLGTVSKVTLNSNTVYHLEAAYEIDISAPGGSYSINLSWTGTATLTAFGAFYSSRNAATATIGSVYCNQTNTAASTLATNPSTNGYNAILVRGVVIVNAGGTFQPNFILSSAVGTPTVKAGSYVRLWPASSGATYVGNWS